MKPNSAFGHRLLLALPALTALLFHMLAWDRWLVCTLVAIGIGFSLIRESTLNPGRLMWYTTSALGAALGFALPNAATVNGPLPPAFAGAMTGMAMAILLVAAFARRPMVAWIAAWGLVAVSGKAVVGGLVFAALIGFLISAMVAAAAASGVLKFQRRSMTPLVLFSIAVSVSTMGAAVVLNRIDRVLVSTVQSLMNDSTSSSGISGTISIHRNSTITLSQRPLLELSESSGLLRVKVMDHFDGRHWITSQALQSTDHSFAEVRLPRNAARKIEMLFVDRLGNSIPSPAGTWKVEGANPRIMGGWTLRGRPERAKVVLHGDSGERLPSEPEVETPQDLPAELSEQLGPLAKQLTEGRDTNLKKARAIMGYFHQNFQYSLVTELEGEAHPLVVLVQEKKPAYCVYFASAMAVMLRTQNVPARIVSGYAPNEVNPVTGRVTVRQRDAHAWVEVWSADQKRYVAFDPTPSDSRMRAIEQNQSPGFLSATMDAIRSFLRRLMLMLRTDPAGGFLMLIKSPVLWIGVLSTVYYVLRRRRRRHRVRASPSSVAQMDPKLQSLYRQYEESLRRVGIVPRKSETEDELLARVAELGDTSTLDAAKEFIQAYRSIRFGDEPWDNRLPDLAKLGLPSL